MVSTFLLDGARRPSTSTSISPSMEPASLKASPQLPHQSSLDGPPSSQGIRAYTEQMKRNVISSHGRTRTNSTVSTFSSEPGSPELKRQSSKKSMAGLSTRSDRPESIQIFGKALFSRGSRKSKHSTGRSSSLSVHQRDSQYGAVIEEESPKKHLISGPYNFQHVVHTGLGHQNRDEVKSRDSSLDDEQALPHRPHASSVSDSDYMSDATVEFSSIAEERTPRPQSRTMRKPVSPISVRKLRSSQSHDSVRQAPPRPPRSPMMAVPVPLPPRTSSMIWDEYDPLPPSSLEKPHGASAIRRPQAFHLPLSPPLPADSMAQDSDYFTQLAPAPARQQDNVGWPFAPQPSPSESGSQASQLADVPEEEELTTAARHSKRLSTASLRASRSVPNMQARARAGSRVRASKVPLPPTPTAFLGFTEQIGAQQPIKLNLDSFDSWEDDIDYCYEHEVEADCDYNWERTSVDTEIPRDHFLGSVYSDGGDKFNSNQGSSPRSLHSASASLSRRLSDARKLSAQMDSLRGMPDPYVSPPPSQDLFQLPEFDFGSLNMTPHLSRKRDSYRPDGLHLTAPLAEEFKESRGFTLSPSLLIPFDYAKQMDMEASNNIGHHGFRYETRHDRFASYADRSSYGSDSNRLSDPHSTVSIRSSNTSHTDYDRLKGSGGSSTSLAGSFAPSSRHESVILERAAEVAQSGRISAKNSEEFVNRSHAGSVSSVVSLSSNPFHSYIEQDTEDQRDMDLTPNAMAINNRLSAEREPESISIELARQEAESRLLPPSPSPCAQSQSSMEEQRRLMHGRKGSVPLLQLKSEAQAQAPPRLKGSPKAMARARASTVGTRGRSNYGLFPAPATPMQPVFPVMGNAF